MILEKMRETTKEQTQKMLFYGLAVLLVFLPLPQFFMPADNRAIAMQATILMVFLFYFGFVFVIEIINHRIEIKKSGMAMKCVLCLFLVGVLSVLISKEKEVALYGMEGREEGLFSLMAYYAVFLATVLLKKKQYRKKLLYLFLVFGTVISVIGILQFTDVLPGLSPYPGYATVPMRNPNFFGAFSVLFTGVAVGGFFMYSTESGVTHPLPFWNRIVWYLLVLFGCSACICASSSLVYAGLIMILLLYLFLEWRTGRNKFVPFVWLVVGFIGLIILFNSLKCGAVMSEIMSVAEQVKAEGSLFGDGVGSSRMWIWKSTIALLPEYGLLGCGIEQLGLLCLSKYGVINGIYFDKAHNEYLNLWITEGIFAIGIYLAFLFSLFFSGLHLFMEKGKRISVKEQLEEEEDEIRNIVFFGFFGYIAQAFFNISVVQVAPYFWVICGLLYSRKRGEIE